MTKFLAALILVFGAHAQNAERHRVKSLRIEVLSTMLTSDNGVGEWGGRESRRGWPSHSLRHKPAGNGAEECRGPTSTYNVPDVVLSHTAITAG
jgi:hypothetical protein